MVVLKNNNMKIGIYTIINIVNGRFYIGSACSFNRRWAAHKHLLCKGTHHSLYLQNAWNKYGEESFYFGILEPVEDKEDLIAREQYWMDLLGPQYNICPTAGSLLGVKHTEEFKQKVSEALKGKYCGENNPNYGRTGEKHPMFGRTGEKNPMYGKHHSDETKHKISENNRGEKSSNYKRAKCWEYNGKSQPLSDWAKDYGINKTTLNFRVTVLGWPLERALTTPVRKYNT